MRIRVRREPGSSFGSSAHHHLRRERKRQHSLARVAPCRSRLSKRAPPLPLPPLEPPRKERQAAAAALAAPRHKGRYPPKIRRYRAPASSHADGSGGTATLLCRRLLGRLAARSARPATPTKPAAMAQYGASGGGRAAVPPQRPPPVRPPTPSSSLDSLIIIIVSQSLDHDRPYHRSLWYWPYHDPKTLSLARSPGQRLLEGGETRREQAQSKSASSRHRRGPPPRLSGRQ